MSNPPHSSQPPISALVQMLRSGQFSALIRQAAECAARWPSSGPVWHLWGVAHLSLGQIAEAVLPLQRASKLMPKDIEVLEQLAIALMQVGRQQEAFQSFERALSLATADPSGILINLAHLANELGKYAVAERHCQRALQLIPGQPEALYNLGRALCGQGKQQAATATFREVASRTRHAAAAQNDVGLQLQALGADADAEACFRLAISLQPGYALAHSNLGRMLEVQGRASEALLSFRQALSLAPELPGVHANVGSLLNSLRQFQEGEAACRQAVLLDPRLAIAWSNLGNALVGQRRYEEAEASFREALKIDPGCADASNNLGNLLQERKRYDEALACYRRLGADDGSAVGNAYHCASQLCDWAHHARDEAALRRLLQRDHGSIGPFGVLCLAGDDAAALQQRAGYLYARDHLASALAQPPLIAPQVHPVHDRLRVGYLSADFYEHATMHLLAGVLAAHDPARYAIYLYSYGPDLQDRGRQQAESAAEHFCDLSHLSDHAAAARIAADEIDLLVDLKGYTHDTRLGISALRPAPVIISWLGYPGTLGHQRLADYLVGDPMVTPLAHAGQYSETLALLPDCYQPNDQQRSIGPRPSRREAGLPESGVVFCSFNQSYKFNPQVFDLWCRLLDVVPDSVLWLLKPTAPAIANLRREAAARGVAAERLIFAEHKPQAEHLGRLQLADLALDTYPVNSHTTGSDALWAGVPLLTMRGNTFASRVGSSLLQAAGLPELITQSPEEYLALAQSLAVELERLAAVRHKLAEQRLSCALFDTLRFTRNLERLYERIWSQHERGVKEPVLG